MPRAPHDPAAELSIDVIAKWTSTIPVLSDLCQVFPNGSKGALSGPSIEAIGKPIRIRRFAPESRWFSEGSVDSRDWPLSEAGE